MSDPAEMPAPADSAPPRPAASLVLLRDTPEGLQVLLLKRPGEDRVLAGAHVFPGGKLDREDADDETLARFDLDPTELHTRLGEPELEAAEAAALHVAAVREAFEETGVLLARDVDEALAVRARAMRRQGLSFGELLEELDLRLDASLMRPWSRWITPKAPTMMRRRFDTRFFVARLPEGQQAVHDPSEAVAADWMNPRDALRRYWEQEINLAAPQIMTLAHLSRLADVGGALDEASRRLPPTIRPHSVQTPEGRVVCYPGDPEHPERARVMPGPTRLRVENDRFLPVGGFDTWFE